MVGVISFAVVCVFALLRERFDRVAEAFLPVALLFRVGRALRLVVRSDGIRF